MSEILMCGLVAFNSLLKKNNYLKKIKRTHKTLPPYVVLCVRCFGRSLGVRNSMPNLYQKHLLSFWKVFFCWLTFLTVWQPAVAHAQTTALPFRSFCDGAFAVCQSACHEALLLSQKALRQGLKKRAHKNAKASNADEEMLARILNEALESCYEPCEASCEKKRRQCIGRVSHTHLISQHNSF